MAGPAGSDHCGHEGVADPVGMNTAADYAAGRQAASAVATTSIRRCPNPRTRCR